MNNGEKTLVDSARQSVAPAAKERRAPCRGRRTADHDTTDHLINSTGIPTIVFDTSGCLRQFTPGAAEQFGLRSDDLMLPLAELSARFDDASLVAGVTTVLSTLAPIEAQVRTREGRDLVRRIAACRIGSGKIDGVIVSYVDITRYLKTDTELRQLAEALIDSNDAITVQDMNGRITVWNRGARQMYGYTCAEALQMNAQDLVPAGERERTRVLVDRILRGEFVEPFETRRITRDGRVLDVWLTATRLADEAGNTVAIATSERDVSVRNRLEQELIKLNRELEQRVAERSAEAERKALELQEREQRLRAIVDTAPEAILTITRDCIIDSFNPAAERMFGYAASEAVGRPAGVLVAAPPGEEDDDFIARCFEAPAHPGIGKPREIRGRRKDGAIFPMELNVTQIDHRGLYIGITRDMSEKRALEKQIIEVSTQEQERIGHEIHDGLGQQLTALTMMATSLERKFADKHLPEAASLRALVEHLQEAARESHALSQGLAPVPIDPQGLESALEKLADHVRIAVGVDCHLTVSHPVTVEDRTLAMQLYRIVQEAVNNAVKHADPRNIDIDLATSSDGITLSVRDDGQGMENPDENAEGLGMHIMSYRANIIGANLRIKSAPGEGTVVICTLGHPPTTRDGTAAPEESW